MLIVSLSHPFICIYNCWPRATKPFHLNQNDAQGTLLETQPMKSSRSGLKGRQGLIYMEIGREGLFQKKGLKKGIGLLSGWSFIIGGPEAGIACWYSAGFMIERLWVRTLAGAVRDFFSPELAFCADSYSVSIPPPCYCSGMYKTPVILPEVQMAVYI